MTPNCRIHGTPMAHSNFGGLGDWFWDRVEVPANGAACWQWVGAISKGLYGQSSRRMYGTRRAHRIAYFSMRGPVPAGLELDHLCRNRGCVNPWHLEPVTRQVNLLRGETVPARRSRQTHCLRGHPLFGDNVFHDSLGRRVCKTCMSLAKKRRYAENSEPVRAKVRARYWAMKERTPR